VLEFVQSRRFTARLEDLAKESADDVLLGIENDLLQNPERGPIISGTGGIRKAQPQTRGERKESATGSGTFEGLPPRFTQTSQSGRNPPDQGDAEDQSANVRPIPGNKRVICTQLGTGI
jgi:hypothetical protein